MSEQRDAEDDEPFNAWNQPNAESDRSSASLTGVGPEVVLRDPLLDNPVAGMVGLAVIWIFAGMVMPGTIWFLNNSQMMSVLAPTFWGMAAISQTFLIPPLLAIGFASSIPMLVNRSVLVRMLIAVAVVGPGLVTFSLGYVFLVGNAPAAMYLSLGGILAACCGGSVAAQLWLGRGLRHLSEAKQVKNPLGIRALMELTGIAGVMMAIAMGFKSEIATVGLLVCSAIGCGCAVIGYVGCLFFLSPDVRWRRALILTGLLAWLASIAIVCMMAFGQFGPRNLLFNFHWIVLVSLVGAALGSLTTATVFWWLRRTDWRFVRLTGVGASEISGKSAA